jgi:hypothetical protein
MKPKTLIALCLVVMFAFGIISGMYVEKQLYTFTVGEIVDALPPSVKQDIAIDFCIAHKRMCRSLPLSSPIGPMDSSTQSQALHAQTSPATQE